MEGPVEDMKVSDRALGPVNQFTRREVRGGWVGGCASCTLNAEAIKQRADMVL